MSRPSLIFTLPHRARNFVCNQCRAIHHASPEARRVPLPTPFVPNVQTFLTLIGRKTSQHAAKIPSWEALFTLSGQGFRDAGIEPARDRRYIIWWRDRFRNGFQGVGGDLKKVRDGIAELQVAEMPTEQEKYQAATLTKSAGVRKVIMNVEPAETVPESSEGENSDTEELQEQAVVPHRRLVVQPQDVQHLQGLRIVPGDTIAGTGIEQVQGRSGVARLRVREGLWEVRRGHKVDGGERRKAEVRYKRAAAEKKNAR